MIEKTALNSGWTLSCNDTARPGLPAAIPATVPGCVHLDLLANRLIPDPYIDVNEITNDWIGKTDWTYRCSFEAMPDDGRVQELVFDGLDTVAVISPQRRRDRPHLQHAPHLSFRCFRPAEGRRQTNSLSPFAPPTPMARRWKNITATVPTTIRDRAI